MILQFVKLKSILPEEDILKKANERKPEFEAITFIAKAFVPERPSACSLHQRIVNQLQDAARRITGKMPLYQPGKQDTCQ